MRIKSKYFEIFYNPVSKTYVAYRGETLKFQCSDYEEFKKEVKKQDRKLYLGFRKGSGKRESNKDIHN